MNRRQAIAMAGLAPAATSAQTASSRFIGVWKLIRCERKFKDGRVDYPYGAKPAGRIAYDQAGRMSAMLMRPGRRSTMAPGMNMILGNADAAEIREAVDGFNAYCGTFDVDESAQTVIHHVSMSLVPSWAGTDQRRKYRFDGNRLMLTAAVSGSVQELVWEREV